MKYNSSYILPIQVLKKIIGSWWGDIKVIIWNFENFQETQLIKNILQTVHVIIKLN
jgi:hypothetical protein